MKKLQITVLILFIPFWVLSQSIVNTVHNLSASGPGSIKASSETEVCIFCHAPHNSTPLTPLWNRNDPGTTYTLYNSSTLQATPGQPDGASIMCLSCHDGTIALGSVKSRAVDIDFSSGITTMPGGKTNLTTDLSDDHPVSFVYNSALATSDGELKDPGVLSYPVALESGKLQCTSCHDPHDNSNTNFLVSTNKNSVLCLSCHDKTAWNTASHNTSTATWNGNGNNPWFHTNYTTVNDNACENCHDTHSANGKTDLLKYNTEENNCLDCHNGNVASKNIQTQLSKTYSHDVYNYSQIHDANEAAIASTQHVECVDCHNPHRARNNSANAPNVSGALEGVKGVNQNGTEVANAQYEYEICYRCHADSPNKPGSSITRQISQNNVRLEFDLNNPSFHPIAGPGKNNDVPSLISPLTESSVIYCTDCHASDGTNSPAGPHGSIYPHILKYNYNTKDNTRVSYSEYELCFQCHDYNKIVFNGPGNFGKEVHKKHIDGEDIACSACHDPHGISSSQGTTTNNSHLINFDRSIVRPNGNNQLRYEDTGNYRGRCYLQCHGENHNPKSY